MAEPSGSAPAAAFRGVSFAYPQSPLALRSLELEIPACRQTVLVGANGSGKSTCLKLLVGLLRPQQGQVELLGRPLGRRPVWEVVRSVGLAWQNPDEQIFAPTVREEVAFGPHNLGKEEEGVEEALLLFGLEEVAHWPPAVLGRGERRRVALAAVWAMGTPVLALDEPTAGLDGRWLERLQEALRQRLALGHTLILATHDLGLAAAADHVVLLEEGRVRARGRPGEVLRGPWSPPVGRLAGQLGLRGRPLDVDGFLQAWGRG